MKYVVGLPEVNKFIFKKNSHSFKGASPKIPNFFINYRLRARVRNFTLQA